RCDPGRDSLDRDPRIGFNSRTLKIARRGAPRIGLSAEEAARIVETIQGDRYKYPTRKVAEALARIGKVAPARQVADMLTPDNRIQVHEVIAATRRDAGDNEGARTTLRAAVDVARQRLGDVEAGLRDLDSPERQKAHGLLESLGRLQAKLGDRKPA